MRQLCLAAIAGLALAACGGKDTEDEDDGGGGYTTPWGSSDGGEEEEEYEPCVETWIDYTGTDSPSVGDEWTVWLRCDGAILTGPTVIRFDPLDFASVEDNVITFARSGEGWMRLQTGVEWAELDIVVE